MRNRRTSLVTVSHVSSQQSTAAGSSEEGKERRSFLAHASMRMVCAPRRDLALLRQADEIRRTKIIRQFVYFQRSRRIDRGDKLSRIRSMHVSRRRRSEPEARPKRTDSSALSFLPERDGTHQMSQCAIAVSFAPTSGSCLFRLVAS